MSGETRTVIEEVVAAVERRGGRAAAVRGDVADQSAMAEAFDTVEKELGGFDVVVDTTGVTTRGPVAEFGLDARAAGALLRVHLTAPVTARLAGA